MWVALQKENNNLQLAFEKLFVPTEARKSDKNAQANLLDSTVALVTGFSHCQLQVENLIVAWSTVCDYTVLIF